MDTPSLKPLVDDLADNIDDLEESLAPILNTTLSASTSKLPLLDKAKLYVLATYAIESLLFSYLRLNGIDAKNHPIFQELTRVKHYFDKLKTAELGPTKPTSKLDKNAAGRFIKAGLAGNDDYDRQRKELQERERAGAKRKFEDMGERVGTHTRFDTTAKKLRAEDDEESEVHNNDQSDATHDAAAERSAKRKLKAEKKDRKEKKEKKKSGQLETVDMPSPDPSTIETIIPSKPKQKSNKVPKGTSEAFHALLNREDEPDKKRKRKSRG